MAPPRYLDSFQPMAQAASTPSLSQPAVITTPATVGQAVDLRRAQEQVKNFRLWTYVAISRICDKVSEPLPHVGYPVSTRAGEQQRLTDAQVQWLRQKYGTRVLQGYNNDFQPVPETHPLVQLLQLVNPEDCWAEFAWETQLFLDLTARFYWFLNPSGMRGPSGLPLPAEMWVIPTQWVEEIYSKSGKLSHYQVTPDGDRRRQEEFAPEDIVKGKRKSPISKVEGYSALQGGDQWIDNAQSIEESRWFQFRNRGNPDMIVKLDGSKFQNPSEDIITGIKEKFIRRGSGTRRAGEPLVVPPGVDVEKWTQTPQEMDYATSADQTRDNNLALWPVPKTVAGITTDVNRATVEASEVIFCGVTINPRLRFLAGVLTEKVASRYDPRLRCWYDDCRPQDAAQELEDEKFDWQCGALAPDERRVKRGRKPWNEPGTRSGYVPASVVPISEEMHEREAEEAAAAAEAAQAAAEAAASSDAADGEDGAAAEE